MKNFDPQDTHVPLCHRASRLFYSELKQSLRVLIYATLITTFVLVGVPTLKAQTCENIPNPGTESLTARISIAGTNIPVTDGMVVPRTTQLRLDSVATATGSCTGMGWVPNANPPVCEPNGYVWQRVPNHIEASVEISTGTELLGFVVGYVWGTGGPDQHVIDTQSSDTTGPIQVNTGWTGTYTFHFNANINAPVCNLPPYMMEEQIITIHVGESDGGTDFGTTSCKANVAEPINVTNGNMYLQQTDYPLPGFGAGLELTRTYNSRMQRPGLFGFG